MKVPFTLALVTGLSLIAVPVLYGQDLISRWLSPKPALTTGLANAGRDLPLLDEDEEDPPAMFGSIRTLPRRADGAYLLKPGAFEMTVQSYCLLAGTTGPVKGDGYLFAPLTGPKSGLVGKILNGAEAFPAIKQETIQSLLWAILSRSRYSDLSDELKAAAQQLLTRADIASLEADVSERVSSAVREQIMSRLPPVAASIFEAEAQLRDALATRGSYEDLALVAVKEGEPEPEAGDREVPAGRWNLAGGYLVRFLPSSYSSTTIQVMVPEAVTVTSDQKQRITSVRAADGWAVETSYDDTIPPLTVPGDNGLKGYAFKRITLSQPVNGTIETMMVDNDGWTFAGRSNGKGRVPEGLDAAGGCGDASVATGSEGDRYADWGKRYGDYKKGYDRTKPLTSKDVDRVTDLKHYGKGVGAAVGNDPSKKASWLQDHFNRLGRAAAYIACRLEGGCDPDDNGKAFKPSGVAVPGAKGAQRLGLSGR